MPSHIDACLASARLCSQIAKKTRTLDDRCEFLVFAASWRRLANEIDANERLIALIDRLAVSTPPGEEAAQEFDEPTESHLSSFRRLATTMLSASHRFMADASLSEVETLGSEAAVADFGPIKHSSG
jgi:hypothetical protein